MAIILPFRPNKKHLKAIKRKPIVTGEDYRGDIRYTILYDLTGEPLPILEALGYDSLWALFTHYLIGLPHWAYRNEMFVLQWISLHVDQHKSKWVLKYEIEDIAEDTDVDEDVIQDMFYILSSKGWIKKSRKGWIVDEQLLYPRVIQTQPGWHIAGSVINGMSIGYQVY